jgi:hypothetical protein
MPGPTTKATASPRLSRETRRQVEAQHADAVRRLLAAEGNALALARGAVEDATRRLVAAVVTEDIDDPDEAARAARRAVRDGTGHLDVAFAAALQAGRAGAREQATGQVELEVGLVTAACQGLGVAAPVLPAGAPDTSSDEVWSRVSGASMAAAWGAAAISAIGRWSSGSGKPGSLPRALQATPKTLAATVERHAVSQSAAAYAEHHRALWSAVLASDLSDEHAVEAELGLPHGWRDTVYDVWSAYLDRRTCPVCRALDGQMVPLGKPFMAAGVSHLVAGKGIREAALHPLCRCLVITTVIPEAMRARLPGAQLDFAGLKEDVSEFFRGLHPAAKEHGRRNALPFLQGTLGGQSYSGKPGTSPETLTRSLQRRQYTLSGRPGARGQAPQRAGRQVRLEGTYLPKP